MVQVQLGPHEPLLAVLTGVTVSHVNVGPAEANPSTRETIVGFEDDNTRHSNGASRGSDGFIIFIDLQTHPILKAMLLIVSVQRECDTNIKHGEGSAGPDDIHRLVVTIQHQDLLVHPQNVLKRAAHNPPFRPTLV